MVEGGGEGEKYYISIGGHQFNCSVLLEDPVKRRRRRKKSNLDDSLTVSLCG